MTSDIDSFLMLRAMGEYGGGFASALADAWYRADATNCERLRQAFPDLVEQYGPGSAFFAATKARHEAENSS